MTRLVITNARLIDPSQSMDGIYNIYTMSGRIAAVKEASKDSSNVVSGPDVTVIDAKGLWVVPGLIDLHTHLREPGYEYKETIASGALSAVAGGFTSILCMANTRPINDSSSVTRLIIDKADSAGLANVFPIGALTKGQKGEELSEAEELKNAGCKALSDDGHSVVSASLMRRALEYADTFGLTVITHAEDPALTGSGVMNEGAISTRLGLKGIPNAAEDTIVARDIALSELTGARLHVAHVSTAGAVELIRSAKGRGVRVTAEATPHHFTLTDERVLGYDTNAKMSPPLRSRADVEAVVAGIADGTIDCIATDHAPHSVLEKDVEFDRAANGIIGLETALPLTLRLVDSGALTIAQAIRALTKGPSDAVGLGRGTLRVGSVADITIIDPGKTWRVETGSIKSKSKNTPFLGEEMKGAVMYTIVGGRVAYSS